MRIAMLTNFKKTIPSPPGSIYAPGMIIGALTDGLVARGHEVTLLAGRESETTAQLESFGYPSTYVEFGGLGVNPEAELQRELFALAQVVRRANTGEFELIHAHDHRRALFFAPTSSVPMLFSNPGNPEDLEPEYNADRLKAFRESAWFVTTTEWQRSLFGNAIRHLATIPYGIDVERFEFVSQPGAQFLYSGRLIPRKGVDTAVELVRHLEGSLDIFGQPGTSQADQEFWLGVERTLRDPSIQFHGHLPYERIHQTYGRYRALVLPLRESESFGMVMVEAMACGTPVIVFDVGGVREIVTDGVTGFVVPPGNLEAFRGAMERIDSIDRAACRAHALEQFSLERMVERYEAAYQTLLAKEQR
ncbi:glycosyltransferase [Candidatus Berkelbacteria bacterium]|nr:glycosyltransferase [Candidatus Berkelbacteria bacterium]